MSIIGTSLVLYKEMRFNVNHKRGLALVSCILLMTLLIAFYLRFSGEAGLQARIDRNLNNALRARLAAKAGLSMALSMLFRDTNATDHLKEEWAVTASQTLEKPIVLDGSSFTVKISDESGKMNVNLVDEEILTDLFERADIGIIASSSLLAESIKLGAARRLAQHILDYIDADSSPRPMGAEADAYPNPNENGPRNAQILDIRELLNIPGITRELFEGNNEKLGLIDLLTVNGDGKINLNTAPRVVIEAIPGPPGYDEDRRRQFFDEIWRTLPFTDVGAFGGLITRFDPWMAKEYYQKFVVFSTCFRVESTGMTENVKKRMFALVERDRFGHCKVERISEIP